MVFFHVWLSLFGCSQRRVLSVTLLIQKRKIILLQFLLPASSFTYSSIICSTPRSRPRLGFGATEMNKPWSPSSRYSMPNRGAALTQKYLNSLLPWLLTLPARAFSFVPKESWLNVKSHFVLSVAPGTETYTQNTTYSSTWSSYYFLSIILRVSQVILTTRPYLLPIHIYHNVRSDPKHTSSEVIFLGPPHSCHKIDILLDIMDSLY